MSMPGFTAEISLFDKRHYATSAGTSNLAENARTSSGVVKPAFVHGFGPVWGVGPICRPGWDFCPGVGCCPPGKQCCYGGCREPYECVH